MAHQQHPGIAREGWPFIAVTVVGGLLAWFLNPEWVVLFAVLAFAFMIKFRDPERDFDSEPLGVVSPVDGIVELVEKGERVRIRIRLPIFGCYSARAPVEGKVSDHPKLANGSPRGLHLLTDEGDEVTLVLNTAPSFARPRAMLGYGARVGQGQRCAWLRLARIAEIYLPAGSRVLVEPGRRVLAGSELIATLVHD